MRIAITDEYSTDRPLKLVDKDGIFEYACKTFMREFNKSKCHMMIKGGDYTLCNSNLKHAVRGVIVETGEEVIIIPIVLTCNYYLIAIDTEVHTEALELDTEKFDLDIIKEY